MTATIATARECTDAELLLGLIAEMPRHGYELEQEIARRGMREWTRIGFSSIYFVLSKLLRTRLVAAKKPKGPRSKRVFALTPTGRRVLVAQTLAALRTYRPTYSSLLLGMLHWSTLERDVALAALTARGEAVAAKLERLSTIQVDQQPLPDHVEALFDFSLG